MEEKQFLTQDKFNELKEELNFLLKTRRGEIARELERTGAMGDLRENSEYHQAREDQAELEGRIVQIETTINNAEIINEKSKKDSVGAGCTVIISKKGQKGDLQYKIVGDEDANIFENKLSINSPLVNSMLGKKKGDSFVFKSPSGIESEYKIIDVN